MFLTFIAVLAGAFAFATQIASAQGEAQVLSGMPDKVPSAAQATGTGFALLKNPLRCIRQENMVAETSRRDRRIEFYTCDRTKMDLAAAVRNGRRGRKKIGFVQSRAEAAALRRNFPGERFLSLNGSGGYMYQREYLRLLRKSLRSRR
jgi:hypothetical protein